MPGRLPRRGRGTAQWRAPGAECSADSRIRITVEKQSGITGPRALTPQHYVVLSHGEDLGVAMRQAVRDMVDFLVREKGLDPYDAYSLLSLAGDVRVSRTFRPISPVKMMLSRQALDQTGVGSKGNAPGRGGTALPGCACSAP